MYYTICLVGTSHIFIEFHFHIGPSGFTCFVINETNSMSLQYRNKSKSQLTSPTPAQLPAVAVLAGHIVYHWTFKVEF
jgi:hypothetical protein